MSEYDPTNPKHVAIQRRSAKAEQDRHDIYIRHSMGMVDGRSYFHSLLVRCHVFAVPYTGQWGSTAFACGEHNIGQQILADIMRTSPDEYVQMMREANARELADDTRRSRSDADANRDDPGPKYVHPAFEHAATGSSTEGSTDDYDPVERETAGEE